MKKQHDETYSMAVDTSDGKPSPGCLSPRPYENANKHIALITSSENVSRLIHFFQLLPYAKNSMNLESKISEL